MPFSGPPWCAWLVQDSRSCGRAWGLPDAGYDRREQGPDLDGATPAEWWRPPRPCAERHTEFSMTTHPDGRLHSVSASTWRSSSRSPTCAAGSSKREDWDGMDSQSRSSAWMRILELPGSKRGSRERRCSFLGWIAERHPDLVKRCHRRGSRRSRATATSTTSSGTSGPRTWMKTWPRPSARSKPPGFPAGGLSRFDLHLDEAEPGGPSTSWFGAAISTTRAFTPSSPGYGVPDFDPGISRVEVEGGSIVEFPVATFRSWARTCRWAGVATSACSRGRSFARRSRPSNAKAGQRRVPAPLEFDPDQPRQPAPALKKFRHYVGLSKTLPRLDALLSRFGSERCARSSRRKASSSRGRVKS